MSFDQLPPEIKKEIWELVGSWSNTTEIVHYPMVNKEWGRLFRKSVTHFPNFTKPKGTNIKSASITLVN